MRPPDIPPFTGRVLQLDVNQTTNVNNGLCRSTALLDRLRADAKFGSR